MHLALRELYLSHGWILQRGYPCSTLWHFPPWNGLDMILGGGLHFPIAPFHLFSIVLVVNSPILTFAETSGTARWTILFRFSPTYLRSCISNCRTPIVGVWTTLLCRTCCSEGSPQSVPVELPCKLGQRRQHWWQSKLTPYSSEAGMRYWSILLGGRPFIIPYNMLSRILETFQVLMKSNFYTIFLWSDT